MPSTKKKIRGSVIIQASDTKKKQSCLACRTNKRSCDGQRPCARCAKKGIPCIDVLDKRTKEFRKATAGVSRANRSKTAVVTGLSAPTQLQTAPGASGLTSIGARQAADAAARLQATALKPLSTIGSQFSGVDALTKAAGLVGTGTGQSAAVHAFADATDASRVATSAEQSIGSTTIRAVPSSQRRPGKRAGGHSNLHGQRKGRYSGDIAALGSSDKHREVSQKGNMALLQQTNSGRPRSSRAIAGETASASKAPLSAHQASSAPSSGTPHVAPNTWSSANVHQSSVQHPLGYSRAREQLAAAHAGLPQSWGGSGGSGLQLATLDSRRVGNYFVGPMPPSTDVLAQSRWQGGSKSTTGQVPQHVLQVALAGGTTASAADERSTGKDEDRNDEDKHSEEMRRVLTALGRSSMEGSRGVGSSRSASAFSIDMSRMGPYARLPSAVSSPPYVLQEDSFGSIQITCGRLPVIPGLASLFGADYNVNVLVPPAIEQALNAMLLPDGTNPSLPTAAKSATFYQDMFMQDAHLSKQLTTSPIAVVRATLDPGTLQPAQVFINSAGINMMSPNKELLEATQDHMWQLSFMNPLHVFMTSIDQLSSMISRRRHMTTPTQLFRFFATSPRAKEEILQYVSLLQQGVPASRAKAMAVGLPSSAAANANDSPSQSRATDQLGPAPVGGRPPSFDAQVSAGSIPSSKSKKPTIKVIRAHLLAAEDLPDQQRAERLAAERSISSSVASESMPRSVPGDSRARGGSDDFASIPAVGDDDNEEVGTGDMPRFIGERIVCIPYMASVRCDIEWVGSVPRAATLTMAPTHRLPQLSDVEVELGQLLAAQAEAQAKESQQKADSSKGSSSTARQKSSVVKKGANRSPRLAAAASRSLHGQVSMEDEEEMGVGIPAMPAIPVPAGNSLESAGRDSPEQSAASWGLDRPSSSASQHMVHPVQLTEGESRPRALSPSNGVQSPLGGSAYGLRTSPSLLPPRSRRRRGSAGESILSGGSGAPAQVDPADGGAEGEEGRGEQWRMGSPGMQEAPAVAVAAGSRPRLGSAACGPGSLALSECGGSLASGGEWGRRGASAMSPTSSSRGPGPFSVLSGSLGMGRASIGSGSVLMTRDAVGSNRWEHGSLVGEPQAGEVRQVSASSSSSAAAAGGLYAGVGQGKKSYNEQKKAGDGGWGGDSVDSLPSQIPSARVRPLGQGELQRVDLPMGSATTYVEAPHLGLPYSGSRRLIGGSGSEAGGEEGDLGSFAGLGRVRRREWEEEGWEEESRRPAGAGQAKVGSNARHGPALKKARTEKGECEADSESPADSQDRSATSSGAAEDAVFREGAGLDQHPEILALLGRHDLEMLRRRVFFYWEVAEWRDSFIRRLQSPGSRLGEELTRQIMAKSQSGST